ncbi:MAG: FkbM family methyltransferase [Gemmataceae bacterium]
MVRRLWKPWFVYRPGQLVRRAVVGLWPPPPGYVPIRTCWGGRIVADPARAIGRSLLTTGLYDLAVSEALARLIAPGDTVVDAGANVGYMTVLAGAVAGPGGSVLAFEPHPELHAVGLRTLAASGRLLTGVTVEYHQAALGERPGTAGLHVPTEYAANDGVATLGPAGGAGGHAVSVRVTTLDEAIGERPVGVLKLDVEGHEAAVLRGAARALAAGRVRHVVFEAHAPDGGEAGRVLHGAGYCLFALGWSMRGLVVRESEASGPAGGYDPPSFLATREPDEALGRCRPRGWRVLGRLAGQP